MIKLCHVWHAGYPKHNTGIISIIQKYNLIKYFFQTLPLCEHIS